MKLQKQKLTIKWIGSQYTPGILELETTSCENFWGKKALDVLFETDNVIGIGILDQEVLIGFMFLFFDYQRRETQVLNLVVHPAYRRKKIGSRLLAKAASINKHFTVTAAVRESNLIAQKFCSANNMKAIDVSKGFFKDEWTSGTENEDGYIFVLDRG